MIQLPTLKNSSNLWDIPAPSPPLFYRNQHNQKAHKLQIFHHSRHSVTGTSLYRAILFLGFLLQVDLVCPFNPQLPQITFFISFTGAAGAAGPIGEMPTRAFAFLLRSTLREPRLAFLGQSLDMCPLPWHVKHSMDACEDLKTPNFEPSSRGAEGSGSAGSSMLVPGILAPWTRLLERVKRIDWSADSMRSSQSTLSWAAVCTGV